MSADSPTLAGTQATFQSLLDSHKRILYKVVGTFAWREEDQQDLVQEIKIQLWRSFPKYDQARTFSTWMYQVALNTAISWSRRNQRHGARLADAIDLTEIPDPADQTVGGLESGDSEDLYRLIRGLDEFNRALLMLYIDERTHAEIGEILGISAGNVATKLSRLKERLRLEVEKTS